MSLESANSSLSSEGIYLDTQIDILLEKFPEELQNFWSEKIESLSPKEAVIKLEDALLRRTTEIKAPLEASLLLPEGVEIFERFPEDVHEMIEELQSSENRIEVGYGQAAHVLSVPSQSNVCYKILFAEEKLPPGTNDISHETELQARVWSEMDGKYGVRVPTVYGFIHEAGTRAMTMELLDAPSLRKIVERNAEDMPENFDSNVFFAALTNFIADLHVKGIYHRDLHAGNVLVHRETGMPCVIDFGLSTGSGFDEDTAYRLPYIKNGQMIENVLLSDLKNLSILKRQVLEYIRNKKET